MAAYTVTVLIPAYNEGRSIRGLVEGVRDLDATWDVLVVDDGSVDSTAAEAEAAGARVLRHPYNIGNGAAVRTGLQDATGDVVVLMNGDGQHDPADIPALLEYIDTYDLVVAARPPAAHLNRLHTFAHACFSAVAKWISESDVPDLTSGFRAVRRARALEFVNLFPNHYSYATTLTLCFLKAGYFVRFVPLAGMGPPPEASRRVRPLRDGMRFVHIIVKTIMLFDPLKVFLPTGILVSLFGTGFLFLQYFRTGAIQNASVILLMTGVLVLFFGLLASQNASFRR